MLACERNPRVACCHGYFGIALHILQRLNCHLGKFACQANEISPELNHVAKPGKGFG